MPATRRELKRKAREIAAEFRLDPELFERQIQAESNWDPRAISRAGAQGLGQLMPRTAEELGVTDPFDPDQNLRGAASYMRQQLDAFGGDYKLALAAYNAGAKNVREYEGVPPFVETEEYVASILGLDALGRATRGRSVRRSERVKLTPRKQVEARPSAFLAGGRDVFHTAPIPKQRLFPGLDRPSGGEILQAAAVVDNDLFNIGAAAYRSMRSHETDYDPDFRITPEMLEGTPFAHNAELIATAGSQEEFDFLKDWYGREWDARQVLMRGGWRSVAASFLSGIASPVSLISFGSGTFLRSMLRGSMVGARAGLLGTGISEALLHYSQGFRTKEETLMGVTAGTVLGGALGAGGGALGRRAYRSATRKTSLLQEAVLDPVIERDGVWFKRNQRVLEEIENARARKFEVEGRDLTDDELVDIYRAHGDQITDEAELTGLITEDGRLFLSAEALEESDTVTRGFVPGETAEQAAVRNVQMRAEIRAIEEFGDEAEQVPFRESDNLSDPQIELVRRLRDVEQDEMARTGRSLDELEVAAVTSDDLELDFRIRAGVMEEIEELGSIAEDALTGLQRARLIYLRRVMQEAQDDTNVSAFEDLAVEFGMDPAGFRGDFVELPRTRADELAEVQGEGHIASRVRDIRQNDAEVAAERGDPDLRQVGELEGIGPRTVEKLAQAGVHTVEDLVSSLRAGKKLPGISADRGRKIMGEAVPRSREPDPLVPKEDPIAQIVSQAYGFENLRILHFNPQSRILMRSPSRMAKKILSNLGIVDFKLSGHYAGEISDEPVELGIKVWHRRAEKVMGEVQQLWRQYALGVMLVDKPTKLTALQVRGRQAVSRGVEARVARLGEKEFFALVTRTLRNNGRAPLDTPTEAVSHVKAAARSVREQIWLPVASEFERLGMAPRTNPLSYVMRIYDTGKIQDDLEGFTRAMVDDLVDQGVRVRRAERLVERWVQGILQSPYTRGAPNLDEIQLHGGRKAGRVARRRVVDVRDEALEPWLRNDIAEVMNAYLHTRIPDLELTKKFGDVKMGRAFDALHAEYERLIAEAPEELTPEDLAVPRRARRKTKGDLLIALENDIRDLSGVRDVMRGVYSLPASPYESAALHYTQRTLRTIRDLNFLRIGGGFGITALGDVGGMVLTNGARRTMAGFFSQLSHGLLRSGILDAPAEDLRALGIDFNDVMHLRTSNIFDIGDWGGLYSLGENVTHQAAKRMAMLNLLAPWTNFAKHIAARGVVRRLIEVAEKIEAGRATPDEIAALARAHVSPESALRILEQYRRFGARQDGVVHLGLGSWEGPGASELRRVVRNLIVQDVDRAIVTPGATDSPLLLQAHVGKTLFQFRRFGIAHSQKLLLPAVQGLRAGDLTLLNAIGISVAMGSMVYILKNAASKREIPTDVGRIVQEGVVRSDLWGILGEMDGAVSATTNGQFGFRQFLGPDTFYGMRAKDGFFSGVATGFLGPTYSTTLEASRTLGGLSHLLIGEGPGAMTIKQVQAMRRIMPYQNLFYIDWLFDAYENGLKSAARKGARQQVMLRSAGALQ